MANYANERDGQIEFYETFLPRVDPAIDVDDILADDNDGVLNGNLLEFKLRVNDLNTVLFQCVKYLSALRIKGKPVPANIVIVDLNAETAYLYHSSDYLADIEKVYSGGASKDNAGFTGKTYEKKFSYSEQLEAEALITTLKECKWTKIHIDENCIVGWATAYYRAVPSARKEDFIGDETGKHRTKGEIRNPTVFKDYIHPYKGSTNVKFQYLMDKLNDTLQKKNLGAFYTPTAYAEKSHELLRMAIDRVPAGNDYIILDRCAGTGNLELGLTDEELSHCIVSTIEYYEYKVLQELLGSKVRHIIPPIEADDTFNAGLVRGADALSKEYVENPVIKQYVDDPNCTIILFENPPYAEVVASDNQKVKHKATGPMHTFVGKAMRKATSGVVARDLGNIFIWSAFEYYLRQPTDSYVVYSPAKYWKIQHLVSKRFVRGFAFNRKHFHTNIDACIMCILWSNEDDVSLSEFELEGYDLNSDGTVGSVVKLPIRRIFKQYSAAYFDKTRRAGDTAGLVANLDGTERLSGTVQLTNPIHNDDVVGYLSIRGANFDNPDLNVSLVRVGRYDGGGFYLRRDTYLSKLPMFCASRYITYNREWTERARIMKSGDGADRFNAEVASGKLDQWLRKCLLFTCLEMQNHMRTFTGSDGRFYRNELCLDTTNGDTLASVDLQGLNQNAAEKKLLAQWKLLLAEAKKTPEYDASLTYGVYQIFAEIDTSYKDDDGNTVWNNIEVHSALQTLKTLVRDYYNSEIVPTLFDYEFLK